MCRNALLFLLLVFTNNLIAQYDKRSWDLIGPVKTWHRQDYSCDDEGNPNYSRPRIYNRYAEFNIYGWETLHIDRGYEWKHNNGYDSTVCYFKDDSILIRREFYRGKRVVKYEMFKRKDIWLISEGVYVDLEENTRKVVKHHYKFNDKGQKIYAATEKGDSIQQYTEYTYYENGDWKSHKSFKNGKMTWLWEVIRDEKGMPIKYLRYSSYKGDTTEEKIIYKDSLISEREHFNSEGALYEKDIYHRWDNGKTKRWITIEFDENGDTTKSDTIYYNERGSKLGELYITKYGDPVSEYSYVYDDHGNWVIRYENSKFTGIPFRVDIQTITYYDE